MVIGTSTNLHDLCQNIRSHKLLIDSENEFVRKYEEDVTAAKIDLSVKGWICFQHHQIVDRLITHHPDLKYNEACQLCDQLNSVTALPAYRAFGHYYSTISQALCVLLKDPIATADLLDQIDRNTRFSCEEACNSIFSSVFTTGVYPNDETVYELMRTQLLQASDPRLVLRRGTSAACRMYKHFTESIFPVKVFLTSAFHEAVMRVLCQDENFLDIDPSKSELRIKASERERVFGTDPTSELYQKNLNNHRVKIVERLVLLTAEFLKGINDSLLYFPTALTTLVQKVFRVLVYEKKLAESEAELICMDLIITNLLCPAITNPEQVGIVSDIPIGHIARFNLMQVAQLVQVLAFKKFENPHPMHQIFMVQFEQSNMPEIVRHLIDVDVVDSLARSNVNDLKKSQFVASVKEVKTTIKMINSVEESNNGVLARLKELCKKAVLSMNLMSPPMEKRDATPKSSTLKNLTQRVSSLGSFKKFVDESSEINSDKIYEPDFFDLVVFDFNENDARLFLEKEQPRPTKEKVFDVVKTVELENESDSSQKEELVAISENPTTSESHVISQDLSSENTVGTEVAYDEKSDMKSDLKKGLMILRKKVGEKMKTIGTSPLHHSTTMNDLVGSPTKSQLPSSVSESNISAGKLSADDILAKYTNKKLEPQVAVSTNYQKEDSTDEEYFSSENLTSCRSFTDTLRKLRTVIGKVSHLPQLSFKSSLFRKPFDKKEELTCFLQGLLAEMIFCRQETLASHIREVLRCLNFYDTQQIEILLQHLEDDHKERVQELAILQTNRLSLMTSMAKIVALRSRLELDEKLYEEALVDLLTYTFMKSTNEESVIVKFLTDYHRLNAQDERSEAVKNVLDELFSLQPVHPIWKNAPQSIELCARSAIERHVMAVIHAQSFFPNLDADRLRDKVFQESVSQLASTISPTHNSIRIPKKLLGEAPWPSAQIQITVINAYKSALDKLACIVRCCDTINNLVALSSEGNIAAADDLTPVLVYVLIQGNPPNILSNLQYISTFAGDKLKGGKEAYYYTLFQSAVEYIKTLL